MDEDVMSGRFSLTTTNTTEVCKIGLYKNLMMKNVI